MSNAPLQMDSAALPIRGCRVAGAFAQPTQSAHDRTKGSISASASASTNAGHPPSARRALWMDLNGPSMFDKDLGLSPQQSTAWAKLTGQSAATLVAKSYPQCLAVGAQNHR